MKIKVRDNRNDKDIFELDVNAEGNIHRLLVEHNGAEYEVVGEAWGRGILIRSLQPIVVHPKHESAIVVSEK